LPDVQWRFSNGSTTQGPLELNTPAVTRGYLNRPDDNAKQFNGDWYITNDVMRRDDNGFFYFVDRADDMFVCGGENIFPGQVESLLEQHPSIAQAAVVPLPHDIKGMVPVAFVVSGSHTKLDEDDVKHYALEHGPAYAHPRHVFFVDALPLSGTNKINKIVLRQQAVEKTSTG
jgi:acyl-coenzyme A synthetase/AMP-(fatty) acid ligase